MEKGSTYITQDRVFIPSTTELCRRGRQWRDITDVDTYQVGSFYPFFSGKGESKRVALPGGKGVWYWKRSPDSTYGNLVRYVNSAGGLADHFADSAIKVFYGVRPALNLKSGTLVSEIRN